MPVVKILHSSTPGATPATRKASGTLTLTTNPLPNDTITLGSSVVTFVSANPSGLQVQIGGVIAASLAALLAFLQGSADPQISQCTYTSDGRATLNVVFKVAGQGGNGFALAASNVGGMTTSGTTLLGGGLVPGQLAINDHDGILYWLASDGITYQSFAFANVGASISSAVSGILGGAPSQLSTLGELAASLNNDPQFWQTVNGAMVNRLRFDAAQTLNSTQLTQGRANLGLGALATQSTLTTSFIDPAAYASQTDAQTGTDSAKLMTALTTSEAIATLAPAVITYYTIPNTPTTTFNAQHGKTTVATISATTNISLTAPTNPTAGQKVLIRFFANQTFSLLLTLATGAAGTFRFGTDLAAPLTYTTAQATDYIGVIYNEAASRWDVVGVSRGFM